MLLKAAAGLHAALGATTFSTTFTSIAAALDCAFSFITERVLACFNSSIVNLC
jgi:hypothetical protein